MTKLARLFSKCVNGVYTRVENSGDYFTERLGQTLYIYLECSHGGDDWQNNLDFPARPYRHGESAPWFAHRGFVRVWRSVEPYLEEEIADPTVRHWRCCATSISGTSARICGSISRDTASAVRVFSGVRVFRG